MKTSCDECGKLVVKVNISRHAKSHRPEKSYGCSHCLASFTRRDNLMRHRRTAHGDGDHVDNALFQGSTDFSNVEEEESCSRDGFASTDDEPKSSATPASFAAPSPIIMAAADESTSKAALKEQLMEFTIDMPAGCYAPDSPDFKHPFTCKVVGPRGSGKTCFMISYIRKIACLTFQKIFIISASPDQALYQPLKGQDLIQFTDLANVAGTIKARRGAVLVILDDIMQEARYDDTLEMLYVRGRHLGISVMSLEQDPFYCNYVERRNSDYYVLMRMRDASCLANFYHRFCGDLPHKLFLALYNIAVSPPPPLGYMIVDLAHPDFKYRMNSFNLYYDTHDRMIKGILEVIDNDTTPPDAAAIKLRTMNDKLQSYIQKVSYQQLSATAVAGRGKEISQKWHDPSDY